LPEDRATESHNDWTTTTGSPHEINLRSLTLIDELNTKAMELDRWYKENVGPPDWIERGDRNPPPGWNGKQWKLGLRKDRYRIGTPGFRVWAIDATGVIELVKDDEWTPLDLRYY
jgi:hypothetical protein